MKLYQYYKAEDFRYLDSLISGTCSQIGKKSCFYDSQIHEE